MNCLAERGFRRRKITDEITEDGPQVVVRPSMVGLQPSSLAILADRLLEVTHQSQRTSQVRVSRGVQRIQADDRAEFDRSFFLAIQRSKRACQVQAQASATGRQGNRHREIAQGFFMLPVAIECASEKGIDPKISGRKDAQSVQQLNRLVDCSQIRQSVGQSRQQARWLSGHVDFIRKLYHGGCPALSIQDFHDLSQFSAPRIRIRKIRSLP